MSIAASKENTARLVALISEQSILQHQAIDKTMKFTQQDLIAATPAAPSIGILHFHEARCRLSAAFSDTDKEIETERKTRKEKPGTRLPIGRRDRLEESLYWLISAATLGYLGLTVLGI
jgi:hypothetical protein